MEFGFTQAPSIYRGVCDQDADLYLAKLDKSDRLYSNLAHNRVAWLQVTTGAVMLNNQLLEAGDGAAIVNEVELAIAGQAPDSEILLFDLAA